jgi:hypothetical protein
MVMTDKQAAELGKYVEAGGHLVATGLSGTRYGPEGYLMPRRTNALAALAGRSNVKIVPDKPGVAYRKEDETRAAAAQMTELLSFEGAAPRLTTDAAETVGVNLSIGEGGKGPLLTLDLNNYDLTVETDTVTPTKPFSVTIRLPENLAQSDLAVRLASPESPAPRDLPPASLAQDKKNGTLTIAIPSLQYYLIIYIE